MKNRILKSVLCMMLSLTLILTGCSGQSKSNSESTASQSATENTKKDSLMYSILSDIVTLDPVKSNDSTSQYVHYQIFDTLIREEKDGTLVPSLAESWEISEDGKEVVFNLRKNVKFHNGEVMTADDVAFSLNRSIASAFTTKITGAMKSAEVIDENTVKLNMKQAYGAVLGCMSSANVAIVSKKAVEANEEGFARNPIGTGPYKFVEWKNGEKIVLESFQDYFRGEAAIKNLTFKVISDSNTAVVALEKGETDIMDTPPKSARQSLIDNKDLEYYEADQACYYLISFNNEKGIFSDKKLREAVNYAMDRESIIIGALEGVGTPVEAAMVPLVDEYPKDFKANEFNVEKAKQLMAEAGYANGFTVKMKTIDSPTYIKPTEMIQAQLAEIGITVEIEVMERGSWMADVLTNNNYEITFWAIPITVMDPDFATYSAFHSSMINGGGNFARVNIPQLDTLLEKGRASQSKEERAQIYADVCQIIKDESVIVPLFTGRRCIAANKDLTGVVAIPNLKYYVYDWSW
ncbi:MAG: ABC transporter substrate-binding protein [Sedimentibacter sp.]|uniref:ABC transporter substrate-binding protein n=1 Tax=Sedimentibacter sp. TaxID=1960295 RepID=UPI003158E742